MGYRWLLSQPRNDYYRHCFVDGTATHRTLVPGVECDLCGDTGAGSRILPFACPIGIREEVEAVFEEWGALPVEKFLTYKARWESVLRREGIQYDLAPGDEFQPCYWEVPSIPRYDFFWPLAEFIVSERIATLFRDWSVSGVSFHPVILARVATHEPTDEPAVPPNGDYDDSWFDSVPCLLDPSVCGRFFEMLHEGHTTAISCGEPGVSEILCSKCGFSQIEESNDHKRRAGRLRKRRMLPRSCTLDLDVFQSHIHYDGLVITERVRRLMDDEMLRNCALTPLTIEEDT